MKISTIYPLLVAFLFVLTGCSTKTIVESDLGIEDAPDWVNEGYQALNNKNGRLFHGVGFTPKMSNISLQRSTADDRARADVAKVFSSYMNVVSNDYIASSGSQESEFSQQAITRKINNITKINISGAVIIARWKNQKSGDIYSLAELDMTKVKNIVATAEHMDKSFQTFFQEQSDSLFDKMLGEK